MANKFHDFLENFGVSDIQSYSMSVGWSLLIIGAVVFFASIDFANLTIGKTIQFVIAMSPIWLPLVLFLMFYKRWLMYVNKKFRHKQGRVTLEIMIPEDIFKSPEAMEIILYLSKGVA